MGFTEATPGVSASAMRATTLRSPSDFAQVRLRDGRLEVVNRGAHAKPRVRGAVAERVMWSGLTVAGFALVILALSSVYTLFNGVFAVQATLGEGIPMILIGAIALGVASSLVAFVVMIVMARRQRDHRAQPETSIAA